MKTFFIIFFGVFSLISGDGDENILCTTAYCKEVTCSDLPEKCQIQNSTHNGLFLPSPSICNCCDYCLEYLAAGDACTVGDVSSAELTSICGPGLACTVENDQDTDGTCQTMVTDCTTQQKLYDTRRQNGYLGAMEVRPVCDDEGNFASYRCIPGQTCYCQDLNGNRIFGEGDFSGLNSYMPCECSRKYVEAVEIIGTQLHPNQHFRCNAIGLYDNLQCIGDWCLCVDESDGAPTYPDDRSVNITLISNETLPCYRDKENGTYYKKCEAEYIEVLNEMREYEKEGYTMVLDFEFPRCDLDGTYQAVQENSTHKWCVSKEGTILTAVNKSEVDLADNMDCKCIRALSVMSTNEKPSCDGNGNYSPVQCRRGVCRCVDSDGNQACSDPEKICEEVDESVKNTLPCHQE